MNHVFDLQLFAEGSAAAEGGEGAAPAAQPSEARLRELGVPEDRLHKRAKRAENRRKGEVKSVAELPKVEQSDRVKTREQSPRPDGHPCVHKGGWVPLWRRQGRLGKRS